MQAAVTVALMVAPHPPNSPRGLAFVTGGTGFLGRHLIPALIRDGWRIRVLARNPAAHPWLSRYPQVEAVAGDITDSGAITRAMTGAQVVVHAAGLFRFWGDDSQFDRINVTGTQVMLDAARQHRPSRFIHISTIALIGRPASDRLVDEEHPPQPVDPYQHSKWQAEQWVRERANEVGAIVLRPGAFYGPLGQYAFNRLFFRDPLHGWIVQLNGGRYVTFPAYVGDVARGVTLALDRGAVGEVYNIVGDSLTHREVFDIICAEARLWYPRIPLPGWMGIEAARVMTWISALTRREPFYPLHMQSYVYNDWRCSNAKARRLLGFEPLDFREGARRTIAWYRAGKPDWIPEVAI